MLVVHPDSNCDICLETYNSTRVPHAVACGHIFCKDCLEKWDSHLCPICRKKYNLDRAKKLHVEAPPGAHTNISQTAFAEHLQMVAMVSGEESTEQEVASVEARVNEWIKTLPSHYSIHIHPLRLAMNSVLRGRKTREDLKEALEQLASVERNIDRLEEDLRTSQLVEESLLRRNEETRQELDTLQLKFDHLLREDSSSTRSRSSAGSSRDSRSNRSDESKSKKRLSADGVYSITPGAPYAERVLPLPQRKSTNSADSHIGSDHRKKDKGKRTESQKPIPTSALGLFMDLDTESDDTGLGIDNSVRSMNHCSAEVESIGAPNSNGPWNGPNNALGVEMAIGSSLGIGRSDERSRSHGHSRSTGDIRPSLAMASHASLNLSGLADFSLLSTPDPRHSAGHRGQDTSPSDHGIVDASTPQSATSWGTTTPSSQSSRSSFSMGDLNLTGLPPFPSSSSLNLGITGLQDIETGNVDSDEELEEGSMTPAIGRHPQLSQERQGYEPASTRMAGFAPPFNDIPEGLNRRSSQSRRVAIPDRTRAGMTPRVISRSVSDTTHSTLAGPRSVESDPDEEELEVVAMRFSQSFSEVEPALSGSSANPTGSFDNATSAERAHRRRSSTSAALSHVSLNMDMANTDEAEDESPITARPQSQGRSVTFRPLADTAGSQSAVPPHANGNRNHPLYASFVQKRSRTPKTVPATPYTDTTRIVSSSSATNGGYHRGAATISAPPRPLPSTSHDPTYTSVMPSNGRSLPPTHYANPYVAPTVFPQNGSENYGVFAGMQSHASYTLQPVSQPEFTTQPRSTSSTTQAPVLHAPQPVSGKSHIGRPWRDWGG